MTIERVQYSIFGNIKNKTRKVLSSETKVFLGYEGWTDKEVTLEVLSDEEVKEIKVSRVTADDEIHTVPSIEYRPIKGDEINRAKIRCQRTSIFKRRDRIIYVNNQSTNHSWTSSVLLTRKIPRSYR